MLTFFLNFLITTVFAQSGTRSTPRSGASFLFGGSDPFTDAKPGSSSIFPGITSQRYDGPLNTNTATPHELPNPLGISNLQELADKAISAFTQLAVPVVIAMVLWGAFKIITSGGDSSQLKEGGKTILWAAVGFGILLLANGAVAIINSLFN